MTGEKLTINVLTRTDVLTIKNERERQTENRTSFQFHKKMIEDVLIHFIVRHYSKTTFYIVVLLIQTKSQISKSLTTSVIALKTKDSWS